MKILLMANAGVGLETAQYLKDCGEEIVGLGLHEEHLRRDGDAIKKVVDLPADRIFLGSKLQDKDVFEKIKSWKADIAISSFWTYILKDEFIKLFPKGVVNFHPGYLPYCRGKNPNVWPIVEGCPGGVTLHYIDPGIDTGDIIARKEIPVDAIDTGGTYYGKTLVEIVDLFKKTWPAIKNGTAPRIPQKTLTDSPTHHWGKDVDKLDEIDLNKKYSGKDLLNILRARTYDGRSFAYIKDGKDKIVVSVKLERKKGAA